MDELHGQPIHRFFHSFCVRPDVSFENQGADETVILMLRAHPITQLAWILNIVILFILLFVANLVFSASLGMTQVVLLNLFLVAFILSYGWLNILVYIFNVGILTTVKVVDIDFSAVIYKETTEARLDKVEDVTSKAAGYFASLFNFGDVFIQTAGTEANIEFQKVPRPADVVNFINEVTQQ